jgi:hypothetical protein
MRISFDVDDTLVLPGVSDREVGPLPGLLQRWLCEPLRPGTRSLVRQLKERGWSVWIYTTSLRTPFQIRFWLLLHGITVEGVVNDDRHRREMLTRGFGRFPSKYPPAFGIQLHVDDSDGVRLEGEQHGFRVVVVQPDDRHWERRVLGASAELKNR